MSRPELIPGIPAVRARLAEARAAGRAIGLVPTMGALHAGHGALIERASAETDIVVVSIFVNPIQFDRQDDYAAYTIDLERDLDYCRALGVDIVFAPQPREIYPEPPKTFVEVTGVSDHLCGPFRPGHFRGVATIVAKLFHIVSPERAYFGEKDAQQLAVIRRMVSDLNLAVEIVPVPTVREPDGLALSSRNRRLTACEREIAPMLFRALEQARERRERGCASAAELKRAALSSLEPNTQIRVEYLEVVDAETMTPVADAAGKVTIAAAVWLGSTRLIDNITLPPA
jgi:pantoate--beta-alanine ligase